jgi:N4-gp56 family major capsid protein
MALPDGGMGYNDPGTTASDVGTQLITEYYQKKALIELKKEQYFSQLADVVAMPKNMGKTIKRYHYMPLLDDANINDQGLDAAGATTTMESTITVKEPAGDFDPAAYDADLAGVGAALYFVGNHATVDATAITAAKTRFIKWVQLYYPLLYATMAHASIAADYTIQAATGTTTELQTITNGVQEASTQNVSITYGGVTLTSGVVDASPTGDELLALLTTGDNLANYTNMPFTLECATGNSATSGTFTITWDTEGPISVANPISVAVVAGTGGWDLVRTTPGATTLYDLGFGITLNTSVNGAGNLYGSSKDVGYISGKLPALTEVGGRVNRVGFKRITLEGSIEKFGFFDEYTQESLDFDSDAELAMHINREMLFGANEITEDALQIDLLNGAGVIRYAGSAMSKAGMSGVTATLTEVDYDDLSKLSIDLDNNRCPKNTKIITGSRMIDTKVINSARIMFIGSELIPTIEKMTDHFSNQAFIPLAHYAAAGNEINGEIGSVGHFRIVVVPEMMHHNGAINSVGLAEGVNAGYRTTDGYYDAYPMLVVGDASFTTIGFQTSGKSTKFKIFHKKPGKEMVTTEDPYGETGLMSIKWYYGSMMLRPERLAIIWTVAQW